MHAIDDALAGKMKKANITGVSIGLGLSFFIAIGALIFDFGIDFLTLFLIEIFILVPLSWFPFFLSVASEKRDRKRTVELKYKKG